MSLKENFKNANMTGQRLPCVNRVKECEMCLRRIRISNFFLTIGWEVCLGEKKRRQPAKLRMRGRALWLSGSDEVIGKRRQGGREAVGEVGVVKRRGELSCRHGGRPPPPPPSPPGAAPSVFCCDSGGEWTRTASRSTGPGWHGGRSVLLELLLSQAMEEGEGEHGVAVGFKGGGWSEALRPGGSPRADSSSLAGVKSL